MRSIDCLFLSTLSSETLWATVHLASLCLCEARAPRSSVKSVQNWRAIQCRFTIKGTWFAEARSVKLKNESADTDKPRIYMLLVYVLNID